MYNYFVIGGIKWQYISDIASRINCIQHTDDKYLFRFIFKLKYQYVLVSFTLLCFCLIIESLVVKIVMDMILEIK